MLTGNIKDWEKFTPYLPAGLQKALRYLATTEVAKLANGEYKIDGEKVFVRVSGYETKPLNEKKWEAHDAYIDVQYLGSGTERIYYAAKQGQPLTENNLQAKDVAFLRRRHRGKGGRVCGPGRRYFCRLLSLGTASARLSGQRCR
jgi:biofilm protein TabA